MNTINLSKLDVAERQLLQAIRMFFSEEDTVSIHTLVEAANQVLFDIRKDFDATSFLKEVVVEKHIKDDYKKDWNNSLTKYRNFFKHADRDKGKSIDFDPEINIFSIIEGIRIYQKIKKGWVPETLAFMIWLAQNMPSLFEKRNEFLETVKQLENSNSLTPQNKPYYSQLITTLHDNKTQLINYNQDFLKIFT